MKKHLGLFVATLLALSLALFGMQEAQAKRMGSGRSFGSKPSYSTPYQHSTSPSSSPSSQPIRSPAQQQAAAQNQAARQGWANRGGLMGMLGGLALGGLLGSLFFGGAFEGLNVMDMLLFAGIAYLAYKLFASKASQPQPAGNAYGRNSHEQTSASSYYDADRSANSGPAGFNTDVLFKKGGSGATASSVPAGFNQSDFLKGAENAFRLLQSAWDDADLTTIRGLTTDKVFAEIQQQLRDSNSANKTEVLKLNAELLEVREVGSELEAAVLFDSLMREDDGEIAQVREVWHFTKPKNSSQPKWFLDGIQQLED